MAGAELPVRATRREWTGLAVLALPALLRSLDLSVLYLALPSLNVDLGADSTQQARPAAPAGDSDEALQLEFVAQRDAVRADERDARLQPPGPGERVRS